MAKHFDAYLEIGAKRAFVGALDWPGWCRHGRSEAEALSSFLEFGPRYEEILAGTRLGFVAPKKLEQLIVVERLKGNATTDFGAPNVAPRVDKKQSCNADEIRRFEAILLACWRAFDDTVESARGKTLTTGPHGGGRSLEGIVDHVVGADISYLRTVGWTWRPPKDAQTTEQLTATRHAIIEALKASAAGKLPTRGPRGGKRWTARYFVRRVAWHVTAHVSEIERRTKPSLE
ncbi:MAG TPA: hypothetical protein PK400_04265 [Phycisphaerales bacterium]|nr:hypothetical protein [Phycisphaerales bacterium]HRQ74710.1 hypothetical protein [Phycisphaerales bacterium]